MQRSITLARAARLLVVLAALALPVSAFASGGATRYVSNCTKASYKPQTIISLTCNGDPMLVKLKWTSWTTSRAAARGGLVNNDCTPDCASGKETTYPVTVALSGSERCKQQKHPLFDRIAVTFTKTTPKSYKRTTVFKTRCPF